MSEFDHAFGAGVLAPDEVKLLQGIYARISSKPWFSRDDERREAFSSYVFAMYRRGMVVPEKLEAICLLAAQAHFADDAHGFDLGGHNFLVVEDEYLLATDVLRRLTADGATVTGPVATVSDALDLVETIELDAALLDIVLDGEMVFPVAAMLRLKNIPFAFVSAHDRPDVPAAFRNVPIFSKPADWIKIASYLVDPAS